MTDAFGEEELVVLSTVNDIRNLCQPYLHAIKNADLLSAKLLQYINEVNNIINFALTVCHIIYLFLFIFCIITDQHLFLRAVFVCYRNTLIF